MSFQARRFHRNSEMDGWMKVKKLLKEQKHFSIPTPATAYECVCARDGEGNFTTSFFVDAKEKGNSHHRYNNKARGSNNKKQ